MYVERMKRQMSTLMTEDIGVARLKERLRAIAAKRSPVVSNGRFFYQEELNALTYWYEDHTHSTRMVYEESEG
jgi:hypothetical protein